MAAIAAAVLQTADPTFTRLGSAEKTLGHSIMESHQVISSSARKPALNAPATPHSRYVPELDGVRGIAILAVLFFHFGNLYTPTHLTRPDRLLISILHFGWIGVDLFFVLSGFLITGILLDAKGTRNYFKSFYARRILRIFPLYYAVLLFVLMLLPSLTAAIHHPEMSDLMTRHQQLWYWLHLSNWTTGFDPKAFLITNFWTLSVEEQFYLVWPTIIFLCPTRFLAALCLSLVASALVLRNLPYFLHIQALYNNFMYRLTPFRLDSLALGALLAVLVRREDWPRIANRIQSALWLVGLFLLLIVLISGRSVFPLGVPMVRLGYTAIGLLSTALVLHAFWLRGSGMASAKLFRSKLLTRFGTYSYGIYVFHGIVWYYLPTYAQHFGSTSNRWYALLVTVLGMLTSYLAAFCSYHAFEKHFLRLKKYFAY